MEVLVAHQLSRSFTIGRGKRAQSIDAVRDLNLVIEQGERVAFVGPNGAGKSTSIRMFTGILWPTSGELRVLGLMPAKQRIALTARLGVLFGQRSQLLQEIPLRRALQYVGTVFSVDKHLMHRRIHEVAELVDAVPLLDRPLRTMSLGQRMRCEIASVLLHDPEVLFLDEPTIGLDIEAKQRFRELIVRLNEANATTILLTSHDTADIEAVAERVVVINHGRLIYDDNVDVMRRTFLQKKYVELHLEQEIAPMQLAGYDAHWISENRVVIQVDTAVASVRDVLSHALSIEGVADVAITSPPLDEVITKIYSRPEKPIHQ